MTSCPFPGLLPFAEKDAPYFFGRDRDIAEVFQRLERNRFLAVIGVSGSGKSSLVRAGLVPELRYAEPPWRIADLKPGGCPLQALEGALASALPGPEWPTFVRASSYGLRDGTAQAKLGAGQKLLLIVDQFEEIFAYRRSRLAADHGEESDLFVQQLLRASADPDLPVYVLLTMRTDYLGHCSLFRHLPEALNDGCYLVPRLTRREQEQAIRGPLAATGSDIENGVVDLLLNAAEENRDELPILQHLLKRLWEERNKRDPVAPVNGADFDATRGWEYAIGHDADTVLFSLPPEEQAAARLVFQRITERGPGERPIRTPCSVSQLASLTERLVSPDRLAGAIEAFCARDLLILAPDGRVDLPHECVAWRWPRLENWIREEVEDAQRLAFLDESARRKNLLTGSMLMEALAFKDRLAGTWPQRYLADTARLTEWIGVSAREQMKRDAAIQGWMLVGDAAKAVGTQALKWAAGLWQDEAVSVEVSAVKKVDDGQEPKPLPGPSKSPDEG